MDVVDVQGFAIDGGTVMSPVDRSKLSRMKN